MLLDEDKFVAKNNTKIIIKIIRKIKNLILLRYLMPENLSFLSYNFIIIVVKQWILEFFFLNNLSNFQYENCRFYNPRFLLSYFDLNGYLNENGIKYMVDYYKDDIDEYYSRKSI